MPLIGTHDFRGEQQCLFPNCGRPEYVHRDSVDSRPAQMSHWFIGLHLCRFCGIRFDHPSHCLSPAWARMFFRRR